MAEKELAWQWLEKAPYYIGIWDIALVGKERRTVFLIRVPRWEAEGLPKKVPTHWKAGIMTYKRVYVFLVMVNVIPLELIGEYWFNYIHDSAKEAISLLTTQPLLHLNFHDVGPTPVRSLAFTNNMKFDIILMERMLKEAVARPWTDPEFNEAKAAIQVKYTVEELWEALR